MAGYSSITSTVGDVARRRSWPAAPARGARLLRVELGGEHVAAAERGVDRAAVVARGGDHGGVVGHAVQRVHEVHPRVVAEPGEHRVVGRAATAGSTASAGASRSAEIHRTVPGIDTRGRVRRGSSSLPSNSICMPTQIAEERSARVDGVVRGVLEVRRRAAPPCTRPNAPTPGSTTPAASAIRRVVGGEPGVGAAVLQRLLRRAQVADAVVEDGDTAAPCAHSTPLVDGSVRPRCARRRAGSGPGP